ncbi:hypothetical protein TNCV_891851 [Trichonephila clavipes]|nr:hypothetical protein TNCV_891851 [Trichonephila clavipes]
MGTPTARNVATAGSEYAETVRSSHCSEGRAYTILKNICLLLFLLDWEQNRCRVDSENEFDVTTPLPPPIEWWFLLTTIYKRALLLNSYTLFHSFAHVGCKVIEWKECQPVVRSILPRGYSECQSDKFIDKPSIMCTRLSDAVDSHDGLLFQGTNGVGTKLEDAGCRSAPLVNQRLLGAQKKPAQGL